MVGEVGGEMVGFVTGTGVTFPLTAVILKSHEQSVSEVEHDSVIPLSILKLNVKE